MRNNQGQALAETLVVMSALVPMVFLGIWVAKVADIQMASGAAARKVAFECVRRLADCNQLPANLDILDGARIHQFGKTGREVLSNDIASDSSEPLKVNPLWTDHKGRPLIETYAAVSAAISPEPLDGPLALLNQPLKNKAKTGAELLSNFAGPSHFGLDTFGGFVKARLQVKLASNFPALGKGDRLDPIPLVMQRQVAILTDQWNATGANNGRSDSTQFRVEQGKLLPLVGSFGENAALAAYGLTILNFNAAKLLQIEPGASKFRFHHVDVSLVPSDRVPGSSNTEPVDVPLPPLGSEGL
jgi:hypothetical protein